MSVLLAVGSPALASYSLAITRLNNLWLAEEFTEMSKFPNADRVPTVISALQHIPIKIADDLASVASLVVLPRYDEWWAIMVKMSNKRRTWNIPAAMNISWVVIFMFLLPTSH
jgi:predicted metallopeptidase